MKKIYEEPMIVVEQYALTQNIASCALKVGHTDSQCYLNDPDVPPQYKDLAAIGFFVDVNSCAMSGQGMSSDDGYCYNGAANSAHAS